MSGSMDTVFYARIMWITLLLAVTILIRDTLGAYQNTQEVCPWDSFKADCPDDHVIVVTRAVYGRMRIGRCVKENLGYLGCQRDVKNIVDQNCSGRKSCEFKIPNEALHQTSPCKELSSYLEATYECRKVESLEDTRCRKCDYVRVQNDVGYLASSVTSETGCGSTECPWFISGGTGQHIRVTLLDFNLATDTNGYAEVCKVYAVIKERYAKKSATICGGQGPDREKQVYVSQGSELEIRIMGKTSDNVMDYFMLKYEVFGCPEITVEEALIDQDATRARITCEKIDKVWTVNCNGSHWMGPMDNCTAGKSEEAGELGADPVFNSTSLIIMTAVAIIICTLVVVIGVVCFKICTHGKPVRRREPQMFEETTPDICHPPPISRDYCVTHVPYHSDTATVTLDRCMTSSDRCMAPKVLCKTYTFEKGKKNEYEHICDSGSIPLPDFNT